MNCPLKDSPWSKFGCVWTDHEKDYAFFAGFSASKRDLIRLKRAHGSLRRTVGHARRIWLTNATSDLQEITFGQIYGQSMWFNGIDIRVPAWLVNWTMTLMPDGNWRRQSYFLNMYIPTGDYILKSIVTGDGKPGPDYPDWVKSRNGRPFIFLDDLTQEWITKRGSSMQQYDVLTVSSQNKFSHSIRHV